ncbi:MAG: hypothetical protein IJB96_06195 [Lachnospira sp.]|nr:hypothetical protein [Lachnospira sp.]
MEKFFGRANKKVYIVISALAVWVFGISYYLYMQGMSESEDTVRALAGVIGKMLSMYIFIAVIVQTVVLLGALVVKEKHWLSILMLIVEILIFLAMQICIWFMVGTSQFETGLTLVAIIAFEVFSLLGIVCMVREVRR